MARYGSLRSVLFGLSARRGKNEARRVDGELRVIVRELDEIRRGLDRLELAVYQMERARGTTWDELGEKLGTSRQSVRSRFNRLRRRLR